MAGLRQIAGVSCECMNVVYDALRLLAPAELRLMWLAANPHQPAGALLRHQISFVVERKIQKIW